jgi:hypothetical protein
MLNKNKLVIGVAAAAVVTAASAVMFLRLTSGSTFDDVTELRIAAEKAGLQCPDWKRTSDTTAECSYTAVLIIVDNEAQLKQTVDKLRGVPILVGKNWIINSSDAPDLADELGGKAYR